MNEKMKANWLWIKVGHGGVSKLLLSSLKCTLEVDGKDNGDADDTNDHHVNQDVSLEGEILHCISSTLGQYLLVSDKTENTNMSLVIQTLIYYLQQMSVMEKCLKLTLFNNH